MQFYGRKVLERHGLWSHVSGGKECFSCQTTAGNWFTAVHHRENDGSPRAAVARRYLAVLASPAAHAAYAKYGFVMGTPEELALKPIP